MAPTNSNETYCTFTLASDVTAGGLPSEQDIAKDLESTDNNVRTRLCTLDEALVLWYKFVRTLT